ncbi:MAG: HAMP domain-containing sensor histidine kinase, partial [Pseudomonadota bacterium]|nr:HAMP domain-containing sensor histidine kinase [Pseudomonadota bacterium]
LSRRPPSIFTALYAKRYLLLEAAGVILAVVVLISIFASRTVVNPIQRLAKEADLVARGEQQTFDDNHVYRTLEVDQLAKRLKEMADALQLRSQYIRDFARHVSHEFKTPIAAMKGAAEVLEDHANDMTAEERDKFMGNVRADLARLERLTNGLMELAAAEMSRATDDSCVLADVTGEYERASIRGATRTPIAIPIAGLTAILTHLIKNAEQHGAHSIKIDSTVVNRHLHIEITDDGEGIPESNRQLVFDPFFTTYRDQGGTGLGLSIARALARNAHGDLDHIEQTSGNGTTFRLTIPLA